MALHPRGGPGPSIASARDVLSSYQVASLRK